MAARWHLVCYDVADPRRLRRIHDLLCDWGIPVNYSVFLVDAAPNEIDRLVALLERRMDVRTDDVRIYALPRRPRMNVIGVERPVLYDEAGYAQRLLANPVRPVQNTTATAGRCRIFQNSTEGADGRG